MGVSTHYCSDKLKFNTTLNRINIFTVFPQGGYPGGGMGVSYVHLCWLYLNVNSLKILKI